MINRFFPVLPFDNDSSFIPFFTIFFSYIYIFLFQLSKKVEAIALKRKIAAKIAAAAARGCSGSQSQQTSNLKNLLIQLQKCQV